MASVSIAKQYSLRMVLLGEAGAGKSSLFHRIKYKAFRDTNEMEQTSSAINSRTRFYETHSLTIKLTSRARVSLTILDTGSRERYQSLTAQYYRRANIVLLVCSLESEYTLTRLTKWHAEAQYYIEDPEVVYAVVGMKSDLSETQREVTTDMLNSFASHFNIRPECVFEVSARTGKGVEDMLKALCDRVVLQFRGESATAEREAVEGSVLTEHSSLLSTATATSPTPPSSVGSVQYRDDADCMCSSVCGCCGDRKCTVL